MQQTIRKFGSWGWVNEAELRRRVQPLNFRVQSGSVGFSISPLALPSGKIIAIRVQDIARQLWFNYDNGVWDNAPKVTVGANLYIAAWAVNEGENGELRLLIKNDQSMALADKRETVASGVNFGAETGTINMPNRSYGILILVEP